MASRGSSETIKRKELASRLNSVCLQAFRDAQKSAKDRGNPYVELVHFITALADAERSDLQLLLQSAGVDDHRFVGDTLRALDALPNGAGSVEEFSDHIFRAIQEGLNYGQLHFNDDTIRSSYILLGALQSGTLEALLYKISLEFDKLGADAMRDDLENLIAGSLEGRLPGEDGAETPKKQLGGGQQEALALYATNLTEQAKSGDMDPVVGRDSEIRQIVDILMRRRQNNPIMTGEAGVGKTAVVEGFAQRLAKGDVPPQLKNVDLHMLDIGLMQAGASVKGEFEKRLKQVIDEVQSSATPIILFIDEAHTLIGAGGAAGTGDAANLLKPALARGELRTIAATTWAEYKQHIEPDPALTRRFQVVRVEEPDEDKAILMCRGVAAVLEKHHKVEILDAAIEACVQLSHRYIPSRQLPDKAISLLDTACARVSVSQHATPAQVEDIERRLAALEVELSIAKREAEIGIDAEDRISTAKSSIESAQSALEIATARWNSEKEIVEEILTLRGKLRAAGEPVDDTGATEADKDTEEHHEADDETPEDVTALTPEERTETITALRAAMAKLDTEQGESPYILPSVDENAVAAVVQDWTGIPTGRMLSSQTERALAMAETLTERVVGQDHAMEMISSRMQTAAAGLNAPEKPQGVFLLCGPSGVGKTETAIALAETIYGGEQNLISINMSEFQEAHTVSTLKGAPPGYVGYGKGGILTEAVRRRPYSVVLLDEVEKAHPDVHEIFFQVFDKGMMDDSEGRRIDFKNTLILLTSNVGSDEIMSMTENGTKPAHQADLTDALRAPLLKVFPAALLGRVVTIPYYPLSDDMIEAIAGHKLCSIAKRLMAEHDAELVLGDGLMDVIKARCTEIESGGRMIDAILTNTLLPELSRQVLNRQLEGEPLSKVTVSGDDKGFNYNFE
ncbi:type VI secretion system ATPase TssH [Rhodobacteraceae bacterium]|nr:type VI secretion system ATPase TssH [Paracoccaceae bacterium]